MNTTDRIKAVGLSPDAMLHVTQLCNSVRLAAEPVELRESAARANGFAVGLRIGGCINKQQEAELFKLFDELVKATAHANGVAALNGTNPNTSVPDLGAENQTFQPALETLLQENHMGVAPMWKDGEWQWAGYVARKNEPTDWSYAKDPRSAVLAAIADLAARVAPFNLH